MTLKFIQTKPFVCPSQFVTNPPSENLPFAWIQNGLSKNYEIIDFDGYTIDFSQKKITAFFMKKEFTYDVIEDVTEENIVKLFNAELSVSWNERLKISHMLNVPLFLFFWPQDYPFSNHPKLSAPIFIFHIMLNADNSIRLIKQCKLHELEDFIFSYRKSKHTKVKPLKIAKSHMECYLSTTSSPWPGDLDGILFDKIKQQVLCILEFKTHNLDSPIENEEMSKYAEQDARRFNVLSYLQTNLFNIQKNNVPLLFVVWGKKLSHKKIKIQTINNNNVIKQFYVDSPLFTNQNSSFVNKIFEIICDA